MRTLYSILAVLVSATLAISSNGVAWAQSTNLEDYVILALESVRLKNPESTGSIGVNEEAGKLSLGGGTFLADGTETVGDVSRIGRGSSIFDLFANTVRGRFDPAVVRGAGPQHFSPPLIPVLPPVTDFLCGGPAVTVGKGEGVLLAPGLYGNVSFRNASTVTLTGGTYTMCKLKIGKGVLVINTGPTVFNVARAIVISNGSFVGPPPGGSRPKINLAGGSLRFGKNTLVRAIIDARFAKVGLGNGQFEGRLIARKVRSDFGLRLILPRCGDGFVDDGEECDDGNDIDLDGCPNSCALQPPVTPTPTASPATTPSPTSTPSPSPTPTPQPVCELLVEKTAAPEVISPPATDACQGKVQSLELRYDGKGCNASAHQQGTKASCTGDAAFATPVRIVAESKNGQLLLDASSIGIGDAIVISAGGGNLSSETRISILGAGSSVLEHDVIHSSCSRPLNPGDRFGSLEVVTVETTGGGIQSLDDNVTYTYEITNLGSGPLFNLSVVDDRLGEVPGSPITELQPAGKVTLVATARITQTTGNQVLVSGSLTGGQLCESTASALVTVVNPPEACGQGKKVAAIALRYTGEGCAASSNNQGEKASCGCAPTGKDDEQDESDHGSCRGSNFASPVWIVGRSGQRTVLDAFPVEIGDEVTAAAAAGNLEALKGDLRVDILVPDSGEVETDIIHVSCSQPLAVGDRFGSLEVTGLTLINKR